MAILPHKTGNELVWQEMHHLALATCDLEETVAFILRYWGCKPMTSGLPIRSMVEAVPSNLDQGQRWNYTFLNNRMPTPSPVIRIDASPLLLFLLLGFAVVEITIGIWTFIIFLKCVGEVHRFSAWKALGAVIVPGLVLAGIVLICVFGAMAINFSP